MKKQPSYLCSLRVWCWTYVTGRKRKQRLILLFSYLHEGNHTLFVMSHETQKKGNHQTEVGYLDQRVVYYKETRLLFSLHEKKVGAKKKVITNIIQKICIWL